MSQPVFAATLAAVVGISLAAHAAARPEETVTAPSIEAEATPVPKTTTPDRTGEYRSRQFEAFTIPDYKLDEALAQKFREEIRLLSNIAQRTTDANRKADLLFRISELYWLDERAKYVRKMELFSGQMQLWADGKLKTKPPKEPKFSGDASFKIYRNIIATAPSYPRMDEVLFRAGFHYLEVGNRAAAFEHFQQLVTRHPKTRFFRDAHMEMADYYFSQRQFDSAIASLNTILREPNKLYNFALYKLAWCYYNQGKVRPAMSVMQRVVRDSKGINNEIELREEALKDLVLYYSDLGLIDEAQAYFVSIGEPDYAIRVLRKLAGIYFDQARYPKAIDTLRRLLAADPWGTDAPRHHSRLVESFEKSQDLANAVNEMEVFLTTYDRASQWNTRATDADAKDYAYERSEVYARFLAKKYHESSQRSYSTTPEESVKYAQLAVGYYQRYLEKFADHKNATGIRFLYAELLFKTKRYADAANQYQTVAKDPKESRHRRPALEGQIDALTRLEEAHFKTLEQTGVKKKDELSPLSLSDYAQRLIDADEIFAKQYPTDPKVPDHLLHRAQIQYNYNQFDRALKGFTTIVDKYPQSAPSHTARNLILDIYNIRKDWENLEKYAALYLQDKGFATPENRSFLLKLIQGSIFQRAKAMEEKKEFAKAARTYMRLTDQYPDSEFADKALFNAAIAFINADDSNNAMLTSRRFLSKYPDSSLAPKMMLALAAYFDDKLDYAHAAEYYELLATKDPKFPNADAALFNAGLYRENLQHYSKALENYETYLSRYPRAKDASEIFFSIGLVHEKQRNWKEAAAAFKAFPVKYGAEKNAKARVIEAYYRYGQAMEKLKQPTAASDGYRTAVHLNRKYNKDPDLGPNVGGKYAAKAHFELIDKEFQEFKSIRLRMPQRVLAAAIERKALLLKTLKNQYLEIITYGDAEMGVAALCQIGKVYQDFSQALFNAPIPKELNPEQVQVYTQELQSRAAPIEQKAVEAFEKAVKKAFELEVYSEWTLNAYEGLTQYKPEEYPPRRGIMRSARGISEPLAPMEGGQP